MIIAWTDQLTHFVMQTARNMYNMCAGRVMTHARLPPLLIQISCVRLNLHCDLLGLWTFLNRIRRTSVIAVAVGQLLVDRHDRGGVINVVAVENGRLHDDGIVVVAFFSRVGDSLHGLQP